MTLSSSDARRARPPLALIGLLAGALLINYVDRGSISTAAPLLVREMHLPPDELGWVLSTFFWAYALSQPLMGWLADRFGAARVLGTGFAFWSVATAASGLSRGIASLMSLRLLMGFGEAVTYPSALALLARHVEQRYRGRATAVMQCGASLGPAVGTFVGGMIMLHFGWRAMFLTLGFGSMLWLVPWIWLARRLPARGSAGGAKHTDAERIPYSSILRQRALMGAMLGIFCSNYAFYFFFTWLPMYLVNERGLSLIGMTNLQGSLYVVDGASVLLTGWFLDRWIARGASINRAYKTVLVLSAAGVGACLLACTGANAFAAPIILLTMGFMDGLNNPTTCAMTQVFAGPEASGRWMGVQNAVANLSGMAAPVVTGYLVRATGHYTAALIVSGCIALLGIAAYLLVVPVIQPVDWQRVVGSANALTIRSSYRQ